MISLTPSTNIFQYIVLDSIFAFNISLTNATLTQVELFSGRHPNEGLHFGANATDLRPFVLES